MHAPAHPEKIIEHVKIHLAESTKIALLEEAARQDRPASELGRIAIELYLFGHVGRRSRKKRGADSSHERLSDPDV